MLTDQQRKAEIAFVKVQQRALDKGLTLSRPLVEGCRYDLIVDNGSKLVRVQVKYCDRKTSHSANAVDVPLKNNYGAARAYSAKEVDVLLIYVPSVDQLYWIPADKFCGKTSCTLRLAPAKNGQTKSTLSAVDFIW